MTISRAVETTDAFVELGRIRFSETDLPTALAKVADLARCTIPGADDVSVTLVAAEGVHTAAFTGRRAMTVDEWQYQRGLGPCLAAAAANITVTVPDMAGESRWPDWANRAVDAGVHSSVSIGLPLHKSMSGAFNVYATEPHAFDEDAIVLAETFAGYAAVSMANADLDENAMTLAQHTQNAMHSRAVIEQAKGIIMAERRCSADEAFAVLAEASEHSGRRLREVAAALVADAVRTRQKRSSCDDEATATTRAESTHPEPALGVPDGLGRDT